MNEIKQCCTREQAEALRNLGINIAPRYFHCRILKDWYVYHVNQLKLKGDVVYYYDAHTEMKVDELIPAYTVAELGEMLPDECSSTKYKLNDKTYWTCHAPYDRCYFAPFETEAEAKAYLLIWCLKEKKITSDEINLKMIVLNN